MATAVLTTQSPIISLLSRYDVLYGRKPYTTAFTTCFIKGAMSDVTTQKVLEHKPRVNRRRVFAFSSFSAIWFGCGQHVVYNVIFRKIFGESTSCINVCKKVVLDSTLWGPMLCLPAYYGFENWALGGSVKEGLQLLREEYWEQLAAYMCVWPGVQLLNFRFTPPNLRVGVIATASYGYLILMSFISHRTMD